MATKKIAPANPDKNTKTTKNADKTKVDDRKTNRALARKNNHTSWG